MSSPLISVIVPCYNSDKTLEKCLNSLINSNNVNLQIIVANDGSTDNSDYICKKYASKGQITYLSLPHKGVSATRNAAFASIKGDYVGFVDSDDYVEPDMFYKLLNSLTANKCEIAVCGYLQHLKGEITSIHHSKEKNVNFHTFKKLLFSDINTEGFLFNKLFSVKAINNHFFNVKINACEDLLFITTLNLSEHSTVSYVPEALYHYIKSDSSLTVVKNFFKNGYFLYYPAFHKLRTLTKDKELLMLINIKYKNIVKYSLGVSIDNYLNCSSNKSTHLLQVKKLKKELRRSIQYIDKNKLSFKQRLLLLIDAISPSQILIFMREFFK